MADSNRKLTVVQIIQITSYIILFPAIFLLLAGDWFWLEGWIFCIWFLIMVFSIGAYLFRFDPALLAERQKLPTAANQTKRDKYIGIACYLSAIALLIIMPLDAKRYAWSPAFPIWLKAVGGIALLPSLYFLYQSVAENTFASTLIRVQIERKQRVISTGVYGFVRHPLYLGDLFLMIGAPLLLGSIYGLIIGIIGIFLLASRIMGEERMLVSELEGYAGYKEKVKYRLVPFVW